jgi:hypothetical protein
VLRVTRGPTIVGPRVIGWVSRVGGRSSLGAKRRGKQEPRRGFRDPQTSKRGRKRGRRFLPTGDVGGAHGPCYGPRRGVTLSNLWPHATSAAAGRLADNTTIFWLSLCRSTPHFGHVVSQHAPHTTHMAVTLNFSSYIFFCHIINILSPTFSSPAAVPPKYCPYTPLQP